MREAAQRNDHRAQVIADADFHHTIITAAGNRMLERVWQTMRLSVTDVRNVFNHALIASTSSPSGHVVVLEALKARDGARQGRDRRHIEEPRRMDPRLRPPRRRPRPTIQDAAARKRDRASARAAAQTRRSLSGKSAAGGFRINGTVRPGAGRRYQQILRGRRFRTSPALP